MKGCQELWRFKKKAIREGVLKNGDHAVFFMSEFHWPNQLTCGSQFQRKAIRGKVGSRQLAVPQSLRDIIKKLTVEERIKSDTGLKCLSR